ncbi:exported hypothetical protein [Candidatus Desulfarcum epimagneticum]|uniref:Uncharacterized protein n=1 Tax=uncultured Desulfobacteraceae bacterium TaxID=218296 RepID=A0A484HBF2_9BACT|nr:exported hypothetical protein [uncultured Desulfobacteraceae bacterium]
MKLKTIMTVLALCAALLPGRAFSFETPWGEMDLYVSARGGGGKTE